MLPVHERLAELFTLSRRRQLTAAEETEQQQCLQINATYCYEMARLQNEIQLAEQTADLQWHQDICAQMFELRVTGRVSKRPK
ncbi:MULTISPECIES: hypothetical protein [Paenibacillus]|uniref:DUF7667 family protein n=1 Tax=Paenibacillus TaxID=44249 RepID=UPI00068B0AEC|nr:hypothetical protein [Paenibacillus odorifer]MEC0134693.1 hypothetical protein [Paenibacillus odorifer]MEC0224230.1 hypothetical protein [Paenibacillus odorifer]OMC95679.1 hypothetical protein BJP49_12670 [Paenibacillus odorifer]OMD00941.1 hypothetical protein BJP46_19115 [Paenibacillus odorifer]OMD11300.1 hypothetical protein BJP47_27085 [Paenibacillus odorifer]